MADMKVATTDTMATTDTPDILASVGAIPDTPPASEVTPDMDWAITADMVLYTLTTKSQPSRRIMLYHSM